MKHLVFALIMCTIFIHPHELDHLLNCAQNPPTHATKKLTLANTLLKKGNNYFNSFEPEKALLCFRTVLKIIPHCHEAYHNMGLCLASCYGNYTAALDAYTNALKYNPDHAETHFCKALSLLALGNFKDGWEQHEWRWKGPVHPRQRNLPHPLPNQWRGEDVAGKRIVCRAEQGLGDVIQFCRYIQLLKDEGAYIIFEAPPPLYALFALCDWIDEFMAVDSQPPPHDYQITLMSMPYVFGTRQSTIPHNIPYLKADPKLVSKWASTFDTQKFNVGICWHGHPINNPLKFIPLTQLAQLTDLPNVKLYSLQKVDGVDQLNNLPAPTEIHTFDNDFDHTNGRFMDTAAVMQHLDLIITVDTSVAHLAGALGRPVWVMLPQPAEWRWMLNRNDSPWYPTMHLFRQQTIGVWDDVAQQLADALLPLATKKLHANTVTAEIAVGELIDKITILEIKNQEITNKEKLKNIRTELATLEATRTLFVQPQAQLDMLTNELLTINKQLWDIEDTIRDKERNQEFDNEFINIARNVYFTNDKRCALKRHINELCGSRLIEEKSYSEYTQT